jgi:hypothetical protein
MTPKAQNVLSSTPAAFPPRLLACQTPRTLNGQHTAILTQSHDNDLHTHIQAALDVVPCFSGPGTRRDCVIGTCGPLQPVL